MAHTSLPCSGALGDSSFNRILTFIPCCAAAFVATDIDISREAALAGRARGDDGLRSGHTVAAVKPVIHPSRVITGPAFAEGRVEKVWAQSAGCMRNRFYVLRRIVSLASAGGR